MNSYDEYLYKLKAESGEWWDPDNKLWFPSGRTQEEYERDQDNEKES